MHDDIKVLTHCSRCKNTDIGLIYTPAQPPTARPRMLTGGRGTGGSVGGLGILQPPMSEIIARLPAARGMSGQTRVEQGRRSATEIVGSNPTLHPPLVAR